MPQALLPPVPFAAATGAQAFDAITWSASPICRLVAVGSDGVQAIRFLGSDAKGTLQTRSRGDQRPDSLMLARRPVGTFEARAGDVFKASPLVRDLCCYLPHGVDGDLEFPSGSRAIILHFPPGLLARYMNAAFAAQLDPAPAFRDAALANLVAMIEQELAAPSFASDLLLEGLYRCVASSLARLSAPPAPAIDRVTIGAARFGMVTDFVEANLDTKISIQQLADVAGISTFHFSRLFKQATGQTPHRYVRSRRLLRAQALIEAGATLVDVALSCGFANQSHFANAFAKEMGMSPGRYRRLRRGG